MRRTLLRLVFASALVGVSCQAVLGIEDLSDAPRPSTVGSAGDGGAGGSREGGAGDSASGSGGGQGLAGAGPGDAGTEPAGSSGGLPDASPGAGSDTLDAGPQGPGTITVAGRVVDFFRRPVPNVPVSIGGLTPAVTDAAGNFSIPSVTVPYDVSLILNFMRNGLPARYGYVYQGLTRADPTLHVYSALLQRNSSSFEVAIDNGEFDADVDRRVILAFSSPDGRFVDEDITSLSSSFVGGIEWTGPATIIGNAHALRVLGSPPADYESHQAAELEAQDNLVASVTFDMQPGDVPTDIISGSISGGPVGERSNYVAVRFDDGTALPLVDESSADEDFTYLVPALEGTSLVVAAADGFSSDPPYAVTWRDSITAGDPNISLAIPNPVTPSSPQPGASINADTTFSWSTAGQTAKTFLWHLENSDVDSPFLEGMFVLTSRTQIQLPEFPDGFTILPGTLCLWSVETHGDALDVDALAGPSGFLDPFSVLANVPVGPARGGGYYTESARSFATTSDD